MDFEEKFFLVVTGVLLSFILQLLKDVSSYFWRIQNFKNQLGLFACSVHNFIIDTESEDVEWLAKSAVSLCPSGRLTKTLREDFKTALYTYQYAKKHGYNPTESSRQESDLVKIKKIINKYT